MLRPRTELSEVQQTLKGEMWKRSVSPVRGAGPPNAGEPWENNKY